MPKVAHPSKAGVEGLRLSPSPVSASPPAAGLPPQCPRGPPTLPRPPQQHQLCFSDPSQRALILSLRFMFESSWKHHKHLPGPGVCFLLLLIKRFRVISLRSLENQGPVGRDLPKATQGSRPTCHLSVVHLPSLSEPLRLRFPVGAMRSSSSVLHPNSGPEGGGPTGFLCGSPASSSDHLKSFIVLKWFILAAKNGTKTRIANP